MFSIHLGVAAVLSTPEWAIDKEESARLVSAWQEVFECFGLPEVSEKTAAIMNLAGVHGGIYGPRIIAIHVRKRKQRPAIVTPFPSSAQNSPATSKPEQQQQQKPNGSSAGASSVFDALAMTPQESVTQ